MAGIRRPVTTVFVKVPYRDYPHEKGEIHLTSGMHQVLIPTSVSPARVWVCIEDAGAVQTCLGQIDRVNTAIVPEGFILNAEIHSESVEIQWVADFL